jgi:cell shape-determining protein MreC
MRSVQFTFVFWGLMGLAIISAFILPTSATGGKAQLAPLFAPISRPVNQIAAWMVGRRSSNVDPDAGGKARTTDELRRENDQLRVAVSNLSAQLDRFRQRDAQLSKLGSLREMCLFSTVTGGDSGSGESLTISANTRDGVRAEMAVIESEANLVGQVVQTGVGGSTVRLLSDRGSRVLGGFARYVRNNDGKMDFVRMASDQLRVEGSGNGKMIIRALPQRLIKDAEIKIGDWVVLDDANWPPALQGYRIGLVEKVQASKSPGFDEVIVQPERNLRALTEVMVLVK